MSFMNFKDAYQMEICWNYRILFIIKRFLFSLLYAFDVLLSESWLVPFFSDWGKHMCFQMPFIVPPFSMLIDLAYLLTLHLPFMTVWPKLSIIIILQTERKQVGILKPDVFWETMQLIFLAASQLIAVYLLALHCMSSFQILCVFFKSSG